MKTSRNLFVVLAIALGATASSASTLTTWRWTPSPTQDAQGNPLSPALFYEVFVGQNGGPIYLAATANSAVWEQIPVAGVTYRISVRAVDAAGRRSPMSGTSLPFTAPSVSAVPDARAMSVGPAVPNPFNPSTSIAYTVPDGVQGQVDLRILDVRGRLVQTLATDATPGDHAVRWDGTDRNGQSAPAGVYLVQFRCGAASSVTKITLVE